MIYYTVEFEHGYKIHWTKIYDFAKSIAKYHNGKILTCHKNGYTPAFEQFLKNRQGQQFPDFDEK